MTETVLKNARLILADEIVSGSVQFRNGVITDISSNGSAVGEDMAGDYITPGLVELHTDHLEGHYAPRPKVRWNPIAAVQAHDAQIASSGITTVFDALRVGLDAETEIGIADMRKLAQAIKQGVQDERLRADHFLHLRCEVSADDCLDAFHYFDNEPLVRLASLMDHAPGQRQFVDVETYKVYYMRKLKTSEEEFRRYCNKRMDDSKRNSDKNRKALSALCRERNIILASHDDATLAHVEEAVEQGIRIAEFPTTHVAAEASKKAGLSVLMGAPNIVRGGSHSGNVAARDLASTRNLDIISSDYIPSSLMQSAFHLTLDVPNVSLPEAMRMISYNPAQKVGLTDRGEIKLGKRADLVRVKLVDNIPIIRTVWREGSRVI
ncbi:alpha-D-ribose 1-methylphosphonate 5-triphosphate diphosphatase [Paenochrobactrum gallinarii]|uniref:Alpha-D-ribose 1-methylphosphonate 5-triphosphate diphosphatase n=1 Tax=Paenochrobactrum gallinarii TaxID=643673 RepID=A0A841LSJ3_9HYPH|nr:alpha-D-ribose 1-methylphosphonate 5-triphosphate diphosphatase [Paenochrobactrum gallinarii]MBB6259522.1 alpha-D-ribose 1-methylphosphonate 5-triphosphate diphosphatase [Paenochrobactrum gallinarii]